MPAPNIAFLYDFESAYEDALANYYTNVNIGGQTFLQVVTPRSNLTAADFLKTPRLQVRLSQTGVGQTGSGWQEGDQPTSGADYYSYYQFQAELTVCTQRNNASQIHGVLRGGVRQGMMQATAIMNNNTLPYYQTADVFPLTSMQGIAENDEIQTVLTYQLDVFIPPSSLPNS